jgi:hypothetical protein
MLATRTNKRGAPRTLSASMPRLLKAKLIERPANPTGQRHACDGRNTEQRPLTCAHLLRAHVVAVLVQRDVEALSHTPQSVPRACAVQCHPTDLLGQINSLERARQAAAGNHNTWRCVRCTHLRSHVDGVRPDDASQTQKWTQPFALCFDEAGGGGVRGRVSMIASGLVECWAIFHSLSGVLLDDVDGVVGDRDDVDERAAVDR